MPIIFLQVSVCKNLKSREVVLGGIVTYHHMNYAACLVFRSLLRFGLIIDLEAKVVV